MANAAGLRSLSSKDWEKDLKITVCWAPGTWIKPHPGNMSVELAAFLWLSFRTCILVGTLLGFPMPLKLHPCQQTPTQGQKLVVGAAAWEPVRTPRNFILFFIETSAFGLHSTMPFPQHLQRGGRKEREGRKKASKQLVCLGKCSNANGGGACLMGKAA